MRHATLIAAVLLACAWPARAQDPAPPEPTPVDTLTLDLTPLAKATAMRFAYQRKSGDAWSTLGSFRLASAPIEGKTEVELTDVLAVETKGRRMEIHIAQRCALTNLLPLLGGTMQFRSRSAEGSEMAEDVTLEVTDGKFIARKGEGAREEPWEAGTSSDMALFRLVTLLPTTPGARYSIAHVLEAEDARIRPGCTFVCRGAEKLTRGEATIEVTRFDMVRGPRTVGEYYTKGPLHLERVVMDREKRLEREPDE